MLSHFDDYLDGRGRLQASGDIMAFTLAFAYDGTTPIVMIGSKMLRVVDALTAPDRLHMAVISSDLLSSADVLDQPPTSSADD